MPPGEDRIGRLINLLPRRRIDLFLCTRMSNIRYLTGFSGSDAALLVSPSGVFFFTDGRYAEQSRLEVRGAQIEITSRKMRDVARRIRRAKARRIGFEAAALSVDTFRLLSRGAEERWVPLPDPVGGLRMRKDGGEIRAIEAAAVAASSAVLALVEGGIRGRSESDVAADVEREMRRHGAESPAFPTIVAAGPRSALPHARPGRDRIGPRDPVVLDFGAVRGGYCSDETLSLLPPAPERRLARVYDAVRRAQEAGIRAVRPGAPCGQVDARVRETLDRAGYLKYFVHSTGHGVGLDIHERPTLSIRSWDRLAEGMVITVEPGVYLPETGGVRIEDTVRVTARGAERITYIPKSKPFAG